MIAAILRAQLLSMMRVGRGSILSLFMLAVWYALWTAGAIVACVTFRYLSAEQLRTATPLALAGVCAYWQLVPIVTASLGASINLRKLLAYPVPFRQLFLIEVLLRLSTAVEMLLVLGGISLGLLLNREAGTRRTFPGFAAGFLLFILFNLLLASGARSLWERLMARRGVREVLAIVTTMVWVLPRFLASTGFRSELLKGPGAALQFLLLPWAAAARASLGDSTAASLACLAGWAALSGWFGRWQFERNLRYDPEKALATRAGTPGLQRWTEPLYRWPAALWSDPLAAIVEKELRSLARNPRFRMVFFMGFTFGLLVWFPVLLRRHNQAVDSPYFLSVVCMYALTMVGPATFWNCFGFDRGAAAFYFAAPPQLGLCLVGKNLAAAAFILLETVILAVLTRVLGLVRGWGTVGETAALIATATLYMVAAGNVNSVRYPKANPDRAMHGNAGGRSPGVAFLFSLLSMVPIALAFLARYAFDNEIAFVLVLAAAAAGGVLLYRGALESAVSFAKANKERILSELSKSEGPVVTE